jgi:type II secretory pathway pseudopilin PulG
MSRSTGKTMNGLKKLQGDQRGWTLVELMLVAALIAIITPSITYLFLKASQGFAGDEMHTQLKSLNELTLLRLQQHLLSSKHMYQDDVNHSGVSFLNSLDFSGTVPPIATGFRLSDSQPSTVTSLSPNSGSLPASFGNCILFAAFAGPETIQNTTGTTYYSAPVTVSGANVTYSIYGAGSYPATEVIDIYRFYFYYLTSQNAKPLPGVNTYNLIEWQSIEFADWYGIDNIYLQDPVLGQAVVNYLTTTPVLPTGYPGGMSTAPITMALDTSQVVPTSAFYKLTNGSWNATPLTTAFIQQAAWTNLTHVSNGIMSGGFNYGVSGNSVNWPSAPVSVPLFTTAGTGVSVNFPGGFEIGQIGNAAGLEVLVRSALVAQGASPNVKYSDMNIVTNVRDVW